MIGSPNPHALNLEMCPSVNKTCCLRRDQMMMYNKWINMKEKEFIIKLFEGARETYVKFLHMLGEVETLVQGMMHGLRNKRISNCKQLGQRILYFEVNSITPMVKKNINKMRNFLVESYQGVYCSICDHDYHMSINVDNKTVSYCDGFCRSMIEAGLPFLLFFHNDVVKFVNLISKYLVSCDFKGDYDTEALIPKKMIFFQDELTSHKLDDCRRYRNTKEWMAYCSPICEHFNMARIDDFFLPNIHQIESYNTWMRQMVDSKKTEHMHNPMFASLSKKKAKRAGGGGKAKDSGMNLDKYKTSGDGSASETEFPYHFEDNHKERILQKNRLLSKKKKIDYPNKSLEQKEREQGNLVFVSQLTSEVRLQNFKTVFAGEGGICLHEKGMSSLINDSVYNEVKMIFHLSGMQKSPSGILHKIKRIIGLDGVSKDEHEVVYKLNFKHGNIINAAFNLWLQTFVFWMISFYVFAF
jgi:hypothetical protein